MKTGIRIYKTTDGILLERASHFYASPHSDWDTLVNREDLYAYLNEAIESLPVLENGAARLETGLLPPIENQEVWAAGVTYYRSRDARMVESKDAGGGSFYERVYDADRPELFFKATPARTVGSGHYVNIRKDSTWNVPEPELTLFVTSTEKIVGYTVGNDMSSRSIEGENPLYLPQAKTYDGCAGLGPCLYVPEAPLPLDTVIRMHIRRAGTVAFEGDISINQIKRSLEELVGYLFRACSFEHGCFLMTGTGIVPPDSFTLAHGDEIRIRIDPIGTLVNTVR